MVAIKGNGWVLAASLLLLIRSFDDLYPGRDRRSDGSIGDAAHASRESDHNPFDGFVHAVDIDEDIAPGIDLKQWAETLRLSRDPRLRYVIYEGRIFKSYASKGVPAWTWQRYTGPNPHDGHLHISIDRTAVARDDLRPWPNALTPIQEDDMSEAQYESIVDEVRAVGVKADALDRRLSVIDRLVSEIHPDADAARVAAQQALDVAEEIREAVAKIDAGDGASAKEILDGLVERLKD